MTTPCLFARSDHCHDGYTTSFCWLAGCKSLCWLQDDDESETQSQDETNQRVKFAQQNAVMNKTLSKARLSDDNVIDNTINGTSIVTVHPDCPFHGRHSGYRPPAALHSPWFWTTDYRGANQLLVTTSSTQLYIKMAYNSRECGNLDNGTAKRAVKFKTWKEGCMFSWVENVLFVKG